MNQEQILINSIGHDQHIGQTHAIQLAQQFFGLRSFDAEVFDDDQTISTNQLSKNRTDGRAIHLLVQLLIVILRTSREGHTTATPDRTTSGTCTSTTGTLLTPWALTATGYVGTSLLLLAALTAAGHVGHNCLVNQGLVVCAAKSGFGYFDCLSAIYI